MKYTNIHNLPQPLVNAITNKRGFKQGQFSVTELLKNPQELQLIRRHNDEIETDVSDGLWAVLGSSVHYILQKNTKEGLSEQFLEAKIDNHSIRGVADLYEEGGIITDWKVTSVYSFLLGEKEDWTNQLNIYAWLYRQNGMEVKELKIYAILRDWQKSKTLQDKDYPKIPFIEKKIELMPNDIIEDFIKERLTLHLNAEALPDDKLFECSPEDKWARPTTYAVKKKGKDRAVRVFEKLEYAEKALEALDDKHFIEERKGINVKCGNYCQAKKFCYQYRRENENINADK